VGVVTTERHYKATQSLESQSSGRKQPLVLGVLLGHLDRDDDPEHVREERGQPDHPDLPVVRRQVVLHPQGDGRLEEGEGDVGHGEGAGAHGDVRVHHEAPDGDRGRVLDALVAQLLLDGPHHEQQHEAVQQGDEGEDEEGHLLAGELVERAAEGRGDEASEADEGQRDAEGLGALRLLGEAVRDHAQPRRVREGGAHALHAPRQEQQAVAAPAREHGRGQEHDAQPDHHGDVVADLVDERPREGVHHELDDGLGGEQQPGGLVLPVVVPLDGLAGRVGRQRQQRVGVRGADVAQVVRDDGHDHHVQHVVEQKRHRDDDEHDFALRHGLLQAGPERGADRVPVHVQERDVVHGGGGVVGALSSAGRVRVQAQAQARAQDTEHPG